MIAVEDEIELRLMNIGGLEGEQTFKIKKGVDEVIAPNAEGKSSVVKGLEALVADEEVLREKEKKNGFLTQVLRVESTECFVKLGDWHRRLVRRDEFIEIEEENPLLSESKRPDLIAFFTPNSFVLNELQANRLDIREYIEEISNVSAYKDEWKETVQRLKAAEAEMDKRMKRLDDLLKLETEKEKLGSELRERDEENKEAKKKIDEISSEKITTLHTERDRIVDKLSKNDRRINKLENEIERCNRDIKNKEREEDRIEEETSKKRDEIERKERVLEKIDELKDELSKLMSKRKSIQEKITDLEEREEILMFNREMIEKTLDKLMWRELTECPVCGSRVTSDQIDERKKVLKDELKLIKGEHGGLKIEREGIQGDIDRFESESKVKKEEINQLKEELEEYKGEMVELKNAIEKLDKKKEEGIKEIESLKGEDVDLKNELDKLNEKIREETPEELHLYKRELENRISWLEKEIDNRTFRIEDISKDIDYIGESALEYTEKFESERVSPREIEERDAYGRYMDEMYKAIDIFNEKIEDVFERVMRFEEFKIKIDVVDREEGEVKLSIKSRDVERPLNTLSDSEKVTLALTLQLSALEAYIQDFPLFVIDEAINDYDASRTASVISYLRDRVDYVFVSRLTSPSEQEGLKIEQLVA